VIAGFLPPSNKRVDAGAPQPAGKRETEQQVIDAQAGVARIRIPEIVPERVHGRIWVDRATSVGPTLLQQAREGGTNLGSEQSIVEPVLRLVDVTLGRHHIEVTREHNRRAAIGDDANNIWAIDTEEGIILIDALTTEADARNIIVRHMQQVGLDPARIRIIIVTHNHLDHFGGAPFLKSISGARIGDVRAEVADVPALSAHADANEILRWLTGFERAPTKTFIVHGEAEAADGLQQRVMRELGWECVIPSMNERHLLSSGLPDAEDAQVQSCQSAHASAQIEEAGLESFPASDPPAWTLGEEHKPCEDRK